MPIELTDKEGRKVDYQTVHITGGACLGCVTIYFLTLIGAGWVVAQIIGALS